MAAGKRIVFAGALLAGIGLWVFFATRAEPVAVLVHEVGPGVVEHAVANTRAGTVRATRRAGLAPAVAGRVVELAVSEGERVEEGQLLLRLWAKDLEAELALAQAEAEQGKSLHEEACALAALAKREAERLAELHEGGIRSAEALDEANSKAIAQAAACRAAEVAVQVRQARVESVQARLAQTVLRAPFAGIVAEINAELGEFVTPSPVGIPTPPAVDLIDRRTLFVAAPLDEVDAPAVRVGMPARVTLDALRGVAFAGKVQRIAPYVLDLEKQARTVEVEVVLDDTSALSELLPGYSADIEVILDRREAAVRVPSEAIDAEGDVLVLDEAAGVLRAVHVEPGLSSWTFTEVLSGLSPGMPVVVSRDRAGVVDGAQARRERR